MEENDQIDVFTKNDFEHFQYKDFSNVQEISSGRSFDKIYRANLKTSYKYRVLKSFSICNKDLVDDIIREHKHHLNIDFHENIIKFHGFTTTYQENQDDGLKKYFLVMEYADGGTLRKYLSKRFNFLSWSTKLNLALQLACAVSCLHDEGIVHCDLNSSNILVHKGTIKLKDLGLSNRESKLQSKLSRFEIIPYVDPKSFSRKNSNSLTQIYSLNKKSDIYSIGVLLWEISSGRPPFHPFYSEEQYDMNLAVEILQGFRETAVSNTLEEYTKLYTDCWDGEPDKRPNIYEVIARLKSIMMKERQDKITADYARLLLRSTTTSVEQNVNETTVTTSNEFGRGIEFREGSPVQLLKCNETEDFLRIDLNQDALDILKGIHEPLAIISVVGTFRRGKSWFANVLHGRHDGFKMGAEVEGCTRGIYMWSPPFKLEHKQPDGKVIQKRVIVLDSEGINDPNQDSYWATKLFILCLAISSTFIYNIRGIIGRDEVERLCLMADLSNFIQEPDGDFLPRLVILLRDFLLKAPESFNDYFLAKLNDINQDASNAIQRFFCDFDVFGLSYPTFKKSQLQHLDKINTEELDEDFVEEVENAVKSIYSQLPLKYIGSSTMKGISFVKFLQNVVKRLNNSEDSTLIPIPSEYEAVIQFVAREATDEAVRRYREEMDNLTNTEGTLPMKWKEFERMHNRCTSEINKSFFEKIIGSATEIGNYAEQLNDEISRLKDEFEERNVKELNNYNERIANEFWEKHVRVGLTGDNLFKDNEELRKALKSFELACRKSMMSSPEANNVIISYKQVQYQAAINIVIQSGELAKAMRDEEEAERLQLEKLVREEELRDELEALRHEYEEYQKNVQSKVLELEANIEQQKKSREEMKKRLNEEKNNVIEKYKQKWEKRSNQSFE